MVSRGRADLHMHTTASDGWPSPQKLVDHARVVGLDVIAVTDHDTIEGALRAAEHAARRTKLQVVVGEEVSSRDGHIVALFIERRIRPGMTAAATVHAIHDQGGLAVAVHPFWRTQRRTRSGKVHGVGWLAAELELQDVSKWYAGQDEPAVHELSFTVPAGEVCVLVGPSGAGKTTAMRLINRIASSDWPPRSKKLSSMPTWDTPSTSANTLQSASCRASTGAR